MHKPSKEITPGSLIKNALTQPYPFMVYTSDMDLSDGTTRLKIQRILIQPDAIGICIKTGPALNVILFDDVMVAAAVEWCTGYWCTPL